MDISTLIPNFGSPLLTILFFVVALSIIVAVHEYGHYIVGRWSGIHAEVFSIGMGPALWSRVDKRGTTWQVAAFPIGGYVKFLGDGNAASVGGDGTTPKDRNTMLGAPLWARAATVSAGPIFNFILSAIVFTGLLMTAGQPTLPLTVANLPNLPADQVMELRPGDKVLQIGGIEIDSLDGIADKLTEIESAPVVSYEIDRAGEQMTVEGPYPVPAIAGSITPRSAADDAGVQVGDVVLSMNGTPVYAFGDMVDIVEATGANPITLSIWRDGDLIEKTITPRATAYPQEDGSMIEEFKLGIGSYGFAFEPETNPLGFFTALWESVQRVWYIITQSLNGLWHMLTGAISTCNLSGPVGIAQTAGSMASQGTVSFIAFVAMLSTAVGLLNLFPIPILDGGHLVFHAWEAVTGKPPSDGALRILMAVGLSVILSLMLFGLLNDIFLCP